MRKTIYAESGLALFEVLLAVVILSVAIVSALGALRQSLDITKRSHEYFLLREGMRDSFFALYAAETEDAYDALIHQQAASREQLLTWTYAGETVSLPVTEESSETQGTLGEQSPYVYKHTMTSYTYRNKGIRAIASFQEVTGGGI